MARALVVEILGSAVEFGKSLDEAAGKTRQLGKVAGVAGLAIAGGLALGLEESVKAAIDSQSSQAGLDTALKATHQSVSAMTPVLEAAAAGARKLGFADDDTRAALAKLELATGNTGKAVKDLGVVEDLARFKHISLATASTTLAQAMTGSQRAAKQLGIIVSPVTTNLDALKRTQIDLTTVTGKATEAHAKLLDKMATGQAVIAATSAKVSGQAQAFAGTAAGGMAQFSAQLNHLEVGLGTGLLPALTKMAEALSSVTGWLSQHTTVAKIAVGALAGLAVVLGTVSVATTIVSAAAGIATAATAAWTAAQWLLNAALTANPIGIVVVALAALGVALYEAWQHSATFRRIVTDAFDAVKAAAGAVADFVTKTIPAAFHSVLAWVEANWPKIAVLVSGPFAPLVALATNAFGVRSAIIGAFNSVLGVANTVWSGVSSAITNAMNTARTVTTTVWGAIAGIIQGAGAAIGKAVAYIVRLLQPVLDALHAIASAASAAMGAISAVAGAAGKVGGLFGHIHIPGFASGVTDFAGGLAVVGEHGPELVTLPRGANVIPQSGLTASAPGGGGTGGMFEIHTHINLDGREITETVYRGLLKKQLSNNSLGFT